MSAALWRDDNPWRRLAWTLPLALVLATLWLGLFATLLSLGPAPEPQQPPPTIEAQIVTLPPPTAPTPPAAPAAPTPPPPVETKPPPPIPAPPPPPPVPELAPRKPPPPVKRPPPRPASPPRAAAPPTAETPPPATPPSPAPQPTHPLAAGQMGARAIYKPMPTIPDDLRRDAFQGVAVARFHVAVDGSAQVEIVQATNNVQLNRLLLDTLKTWRFFPAMRNGQPVDSTIEIRIPITIR